MFFVTHSHTLALLYAEVGGYSTCNYYNLHVRCVVSTALHVECSLFARFPFIVIMTFEGIKRI